MAYEDLTTQEKIIFHEAVSNKHRSCIKRLTMPIETEQEKTAQTTKITALMAETISADSFKRKKA